MLWVMVTGELVQVSGDGRGTRVLARVRDVALILASVCMVVWTVLLLWMWASVGQELAERTDPAVPAGEVVPDVACTPVPGWPC